MNQFSLRHLFVALVVVSFVSFFGVPLGHAEARSSTDSFDIPIVPGSTMTNDCNGDVVILDGGSLHVLVHMTQASSGNFSFHTLIHPANVSGVTATGRKYRWTGVTISSVTSSAPQFETTVVSRQDMVSQGNEPNFKIDLLVHVTINANGDLTANVANFSTSCQ